MTAVETPVILERPDVDWERHKGNGSPKILPPPGETWRNPATNRKVGHRYYTRVTTYADALSEQYNLTQWKLRRALLGMGRRPDYVRLASALTDDDRDRDALDELAVKALEAAGPNAADLGTALHALTERIDRGEPLGDVPPEVIPDVTAYTALVEGVISYVHREARTVCDELECAGTPDGHAIVSETPPTDRGVVCDCPPDVLRIIDTKTGSIRYPAKMGVQLAIYAHSDLYRPEDGTRTPLTVCPHWGVIVHLPVETGRAAPYWLDLEFGWRGAQLCGPVREWRKAKADDLLIPFAGVLPVQATPDGEVTRVEPRLASTNTTSAPPPTELTEVTIETPRGPHEAPEPDDEGDEAALHEDLVEQPALEAVAGRCEYLELGNDPGARQCKLAAGHPGAHEFETATVPVERCATTDLRIGECACTDCRPDLAAVGDDGVQPDEGPTEVDLMGRLRRSVERAAVTLTSPEDGTTGTLIGPADRLAEMVRPEAVVEWPGVDDQPEPADPIADAILACTTKVELERLGTTAWRTWTPAHKQLASDRHDQLAGIEQAAEAARKPIAAFEAAVATAATRAELVAIMGEAGGAPWMTPELEALAGARWSQVSA